tara:strand:- start:18039 stop:18590 length:552 start_codon:yes stop_codon:yes gene_type:complete
LEDISKNLEEINENINELSEYNVLFEELEENSFFDPEISIHAKDNDFLQSRVLISEIIGKKEIIDRLNNLKLHVGSLKEAMLDDNDQKIKNKINMILSNEYSSIKTIISELNFLKNKTDELEKLHINLLNNSIISLDMKVVLEQELKKKQELDAFYDRQKNLLLNLSSIFVKLAKSSIPKNRK